ncbi:MAG: F0F1 ATP synthase subunit B [Rhodobacteraceae bacterium]|nr:F0F1 ATP synthase subunit B [Paracoccaceae bacterium]
MQRIITAVVLAGAATPALAATEGKPFFSLANTDFVVLISFILFIGILVYFKVPGMLTGMLDQRAVRIAAELDEAKALREEARALLSSYEKKSRDMQAQADRIVAQAKASAEAAAAEAREALKQSIARRLATAEEQIAAAEAAAVREVRNRAVTVAVAAAGDVIAGSMAAADANRLIDQSIDTVAAKLH